MFTHIRVMAMHGAPVFFCGEKPILYPCISWSGYDDTVKEFDVQADETGLAQVPEEKYSFSPLFWNTPRLELESTEDFNIAECGGRVSIYQIGDPGIIPNIPDGGCDSKDIEGENDLAHIPSKVDCPLAINSDELNRMIKLKKESCQRP